jgi:hypothetical protein
MMEESKSHLTGAGPAIRLPWEVEANSVKRKTFLALKK